MSSVSIIFKDLNEIFDLGFDVNTPHRVVLPFSSIRDNVASPLLSNKSLLRSIIVDHSFENDDCVEVCRFLGLHKFIIQIDATNCLQFASNVVSLLHKDREIRFIVVCESILTWLRFIELVGYCKGVTCCPILSKSAVEMNVWATASLKAAIVTRQQFDDAGKVLDEWKPFISHLRQRNAYSLFLSNMPELGKCIESYEYFTRPISKCLSAFALSPPIPALPDREIFQKAISQYFEKSKENDTVCLFADNAIIFIQLCFECGASHVTAVHHNPIECRKIDLFASQMFPGKVDVINGDIDVVQKEKRFEIVITDMFSDFLSLPEYFHRITNGNIMIPSSLESVIFPIFSQHLWFLQKENGLFNSISLIDNPSVLSLAKPQPLFKFSPQAEIVQTQNIDFYAIIGSTIHGFICESTIFISPKIPCPPQKFYLPLLRPVCVKKDEKITLRIERKSDGRKAYVQWCLISPEFTPIQNHNGIAWNCEL